MYQGARSILLSRGAAVRCFSGLIASLLMVVASGVVPAQEEDDKLLKAAFIFNFATFTTWPIGTLPEVDDVMNLCLVGSDNLDEPLRRLTGKTVHGRRLLVRKVADGEPLEHCAVLYVASSQRENMQLVLDRVASKPILSVSELPSFANRGGIIELYQEDERIRFRINLEAAERSGLTLSSRLLRLAKIVGGGA